MLSLRPPPTDWERSWKANNEAHPLVSDWAFKGVGIGVQDLDSTIDYYAGIGFQDVSDEIVDSTLGVRSRSVKVGPLDFNFSQPLVDASICSDSLAKRGDGVNDLSFSVASLVEERGKLESKGVELVNESQDGRSAFFDTRSEGNIMIRLDQR